MQLIKLINYFEVLKNNKNYKLNILKQLINSYNLTIHLNKIKL